MSRHTLDQKFRVCGRCQNFDRRCRSITMLKWSRLLEDRKYAIVRQETVKGLFVSTVWLGLDHGYSYGLASRPIIFETMIFAGKGGAAGNMWRWFTEAEAIEGHRQIVRAIHEDRNLEEMPIDPTEHRRRKRKYMRRMTKLALKGEF